jgi:hypothetical protein
VTSSQPLTLWVDAVCINQNDLDERSQQVAMMRDIYASAEQLFIWLGDDDESTGGAQSILDIIKELDDHNSYSKAESQPITESRLHLMHQCDDFYLGLAQSRPWFSRVWILQELAMAKNDPFVVCGWNRVCWSTFVRVWKAIAREVFTEMGMVGRSNGDSGRLGIPSAIGDDAAAVGANDNDDEIMSKIKLDILDDLLSARRSKGGETLRRLLLISRTSQSTEPRDRIYGLLGLLSPDELSPPNSIHVAVDYRKPVWEVYADAMSHILSRGEGPYFVSGVFLPGASAHAPPTPSLQFTSSQQLLHGLPSWVPDFSRQTADTATQPSGMRFHPPACMTASGAGANCINGWRLPDKRTLQVEGLVVGVVSEVTHLGKSLAEVIRQLPCLESVALAAKQRPSTLQDATIAPLLDRFRRKEPFWRILICNRRYMSGYDVAPASYQDMYSNLLEYSQRCRIDEHSSSDRPGQESTRERNEYELHLEQEIGQRVLFTTDNGFVGTCIPDARVGDVIAIWFGSPVPFVMRPDARLAQIKGAERQTHSLVGASYVGGIMDGEMVDELYCEDLVDSTTFYVR